MSDEIFVRVNSYGAGRPLGLVYFDPVSGKKKAKSSGTTDWREAERQAGELGRELRAERSAAPSKVTWQQFLDRYTQEKLLSLRPRTRKSALESLAKFHRFFCPDRLVKVNAALCSRFQVELRKAGAKETTIAHHLRHVKAALRWAERQGMLPKAPAIEMPQVSGQDLAKSRPITTEEYERLLLAVPKVRPHDAPAWSRFIEGLWLSGLRLGEAVALSWDLTAGFRVDFQHGRPVFSIRGNSQKSRKDETAPITPDFGAWLLAVPEMERVGNVFPLPIGAHKVGVVVGRIAERAGVVVGTTAKVRKRKAGRRRVTDGGEPAWLIQWDGDSGEPEAKIMHGTAAEADRECRRKRDGKLVAVTVKQFAGAHSLRRSFAVRWSKRVPAAVLRKLCRHASVSTTLAYYAVLDAADLSADLWAKWGSPPVGDTSRAGNTSGNTAPPNGCGPGDAEPAKSLPATS